MADTAEPAKVPRRKRSHKSSLNSVDGSAQFDDAKRIPMACVACRKRKIRCDGGQPSCANCSKNGKNGCRYERVSAEENLEVKMRKRQAKLRKEQSARHQQEDSSSQLGTRRRWSRTISFDRNTYLPGPPPLTSNGSVPYLSPSPSGLSTAARHLSLDSARSPYYPGQPGVPAPYGGYFDHPGSPYPITPGDEAPDYFVSVPVQAAPRYLSYERVPSGHSPYPITPRSDDGCSCAHDLNCTCQYAPPVMAASAPQQQPRPAFTYSRSAPGLLSGIPFGTPYGRGPVPVDASPYPSALSPALPPPPPYLVERYNNNSSASSRRGSELVAPIPVRAMPQQPSFIRAEAVSQMVVGPPPGFTPYPVLGNGLVSGADGVSGPLPVDAFLAPGGVNSWVDALREDPSLAPASAASGAYAEMWIGEQSKTAAPMGADLNHFEPSVW